jgi:hypothetical protein
MAGELSDDEINALVVKGMISPDTAAKMMKGQMARPSGPIGLSPTGRTANLMMPTGTGSFADKLAAIASEAASKKTAEHAAEMQKKYETAAAAADAAKMEAQMRPPEGRGTGTIEVTDPKEVDAMVAKGWMSADAGEQYKAAIAQGNKLVMPALAPKTPYKAPQPNDLTGAQLASAAKTAKTGGVPDQGNAAGMKEGAKVGPESAALGVPANKQVIDPALVDALQHSGEVSPETAKKLHEINATPTDKAWETSPPWAGSIAEAGKAAAKEAEETKKKKAEESKTATAETTGGGV